MSKEQVVDLARESIESLSIKVDTLALTGDERAFLASVFGWARVRVLEQSDEPECDLRDSDESVAAPDDLSQAVIAGVNRALAARRLGPTESRGSWANGPSHESGSNEGASCLCPSARSDHDESMAFAVVAGTATRPRVRYLREPLPAESVRVMTDQVAPEEVFRFAAPCAEERCIHHTGSQCSLGNRIANTLSSSVEILPRCSIRKNCRWWKEQGRDACHRCPSVVTFYSAPRPDIVEVAHLTHSEGKVVA
jgi:hypothetical protein